MLDVIKREIADKIIIVDKFDTMSDDSEIIKFIRESSNLFIVAAHKEFKQCGYSTDSMLGLKHDGKDYEAYKLFETPRDFMTKQSELI
jgi:hypothetical protein